MDDYLLTVVTPTFNRAHTLGECYASLCSQTDKRFVWLIIDDGSNDNTEELINSWKYDGNINIQYIKKNNGGKASALNVGIGLLKTPYAVCLDSDDTFYPNTVQLALISLEKIQNDKNCCGVLALRHNPDGTVMGKKEMPSNITSITAADLFLRYNLNTELICFYKVEILKQYRFPEFEGEKFVSPAWMQYEITQDYYYAPSWDKLCCCEYIQDGLTKNKKSIIKKNPRGYAAVKKYSFDLAPTLCLQIKHGIMYDYGCLLSKEKNWVKGTKHKFLAVVLMPLAVCVKIIRDKKS